ncbi:MAG: hypothetical protein R3D34_04825 [Nitratireductor sp.]
MLVDETSLVKDRIAAMSLEDPSLQFSACGNTHAAMSKKAGHDIQLIAEATMVPSGVVRLMELQEQGLQLRKAVIPNTPPSRANIKKGAVMRPFL